MGTDVKDIPSALEILKGYHWTGNVRELENSVKKAIVCCKGEVIFPEDLSFENEMNSTSPSHDGKVEERMTGLLDKFLVESSLLSSREGLSAISFLEERLIIKSLERTNGNQVKAAHLLGINRNSLRRRMEKYGIRKEVSIF